MGGNLAPPPFAVADAVSRALAEDLTPLGDVTAALVPPGPVEARFVARAGGVLAGTACATEAFRQVDPEVAVSWAAADGERVAVGQALGTVAGELASVLTAERTALNFLGHLSGVASLTRRFVDAVAAEGTEDQRTRVWDTRKTTPGLRTLEKAAVRAGGGANHRGNLSEWVMLKDNHLARVGIAGAVRAARQMWPGRTVQVECDHLAQVEEALAAGADLILLDNMTPAAVRACVESADRHGASGRRPLLEASGNITLDTVGAYAAAGVDLVSASAITASAPTLDIGLDLDPTRSPDPAAAR